MVIIENGRQAADIRHEEGVQFRCSQCHEIKPVGTKCGTGYARDSNNNLICYDCCGINDKAEMIATGKAVMYLTCEPASKAFDRGRPFTTTRGSGRNTQGTVSNWPGTLSFTCYTTYGRHNIARWRYDCWFTGPDGFECHGVQYGDNTQICHCRRTKTKAH